MRLAASALLLLLALVAAGGHLAARDPTAAERLYRAGRYAEAYHHLLETAETLETGRRAALQPALDYDAGSALYRLGRYGAAAARFGSALAAGSPGLRQRSAYNMGNAYVRAAEAAAGLPPPVLRDPNRTRSTPGGEVVSSAYEALRRAITAYEEALQLDPDDADARWNLELALRKLDEADPGPGGVGRRYRATWGQANLNRADYRGTPDTAAGTASGGGAGAPPGEAARELSEAEARQLLQAVQRDQLETLRGRDPRPGAASPSRRDW